MPGAASTTDSRSPASGAIDIFPIPSERIFVAVKGLGGNARLVMLPKQSHDYRARESILTMLAETNDWLDKYVKNAMPMTDAANV